MPMFVRFITMMAVVTCCPALVCGRPHWKLPFTIDVAAHGNLLTHTWFVPTHGHGTDSYTSNDATREFSFSVDSSKDVTFFSTGDTVHETGTYSFVGDTLRYYMRSISTGPYPGRDSSLVIIVFTMSMDSVISLLVSHGSMTSYAYYDRWSSFSFRAGNFGADDSSIYTLDSTLSGHQITAEYAEGTADYYWGRQYAEFGQFSSSQLSLSFIELSGIFKPITLVDVASVMSSAVMQPGMSVTQTGHDLRFAFSGAYEVGFCELYSILGERIATGWLAAGQPEWIVHGLPQGCYFARLGKRTLKVLVSQ